MTERSQSHQPANISRGRVAKVLISFATTEGQTRKIAERISSQVRQRGYEVSIYDTASVAGVHDVDAFDATIVAASVHEQHHQDSAINFATAHRDQLHRKPSAFISVSLSTAMPNGLAEAQHYVDRFMDATGWTPMNILLLGGALHWSECDYFQRQVLKHILQKGDVPLSEDANYEFTDWVVLQSFVDDFLTRYTPLNIELVSVVSPPTHFVH
jgi:menaquinone-dependent protoporphyrinogen oxidase